MGAVVWPCQLFCPCFCFLFRNQGIILPERFRCPNYLGFFSVVVLLRQPSEILNWAILLEHICQLVNAEVASPSIWYQKDEMRNETSTKVVNLLTSLLFTLEWGKSDQIFSQNLSFMTFWAKCENLCITIFCFFIFMVFFSINENYNFMHILRKIEVWNVYWSSDFFAYGVPLLPPQPPIDLVTLLSINQTVHFKTRVVTMS